ncbi:AAA family ATPase [Microbulbifer sp.]|uniref:AAA family ATPase n=1 Tax=Microbulbifer sp. TaxID=1908541 RepID=UPI003F2BB3C7
MIEQIAIRNFKCFEDVKVPIRPLTVLAGVNGMGKSSCMQSMLLLRQSLKAANGDQSAQLNGPLVELGYADDVFYEGADDEEPIVLSMTENGKNLDWSFRYKNGAQQLDGAVEGKIKGPSRLIDNDDFFYLKAERIGPRTVFSANLDTRDKLNTIGNAGEYCAHLLATQEREPLNLRSLLHEDLPEINEVRAQVEMWLSEIGQTPRIHLDQHPRMDLVSLQFSFVRSGIPSDKYRPTNVGFGLTYGLPIFVACLTASPRSLILIENPEAHLHPKGQVAIGKFLGKVAAAGVQIIIETHSDHVLNGIRISVKNGIIKGDEVALNFFQRETGQQSTSLTSPKINPDGRLDFWPDGFFDEWEKGLAELL